MINEGYIQAQIDAKQEMISFIDTSSSTSKYEEQNGAEEYIEVIEQLEDQNKRIIQLMNQIQNVDSNILMSNQYNKRVMFGKTVITPNIYLLAHGTRWIKRRCWRGPDDAYVNHLNIQLQLNLSRILSLFVSSHIVLELIEFMRFILAYILFVIPQWALIVRYSYHSLLLSAFLIQLFNFCLQIFLCFK